MQGFNASHIAVGDIDGDSYKDIVLSQYSRQKDDTGRNLPGTDTNSDKYVSILWGSRDGFSSSQSTGFETKYVKASAIGDIDNDGNSDLALAIYQGDVTFSTNSIILFGKGNRQFEQGKERHPDCGFYACCSGPPGKRISGQTYLLQQFWRICR